jgi:Flp pilus assembly pilin Flp
MLTLLRTRIFIDCLFVRARGSSRESGQTLVEYGLLAVLLAGAAFVILGLVGQDVVNLFTKVSTDLQNATTT